VDATVTQLADRLLASYATVGGINHVDGPNLPSKSAISSITQDLLRLVFPGFFDERPLVSSELKVETTLLLASVRERLEDEILKSLEYAPSRSPPANQLAAAARQLTSRFPVQPPVRP
jgi:serine O-acetyltransferase